MMKIEKYLEYPQDTRWAADEEITSPISSVKLDISQERYESAGLILKSDGKTVYVDGLDNHSMVIGSTGSGKSRLICMPMIGIMANAGESFIATDPKAELFRATSGLAKQQGYQVVVLNFREITSGDMWNPLLIPYELYQKGKTDPLSRDRALSLINDLVMAITAQETGAQEQFWIQMAQSLMMANILLLFETGKKEEINMLSLSRLCQDYGKPPHMNALYKLQKYIDPDSIAGMNYAGVCIEAEKTQSSIMSMVHGFLRVFNTQEGLMRMMADSTFDMRSFGRKKTAVYLIIPDEKSTFHFLASTFTKQCYEMLIAEAHKEETGELPVRVNFVLDEFANLPVIRDMPNMISAARSRKIRFHLVIQSMSQLESKYGKDAETISSNCENLVYLNSKEFEFLERISRRCGTLVDNHNQVRPLISPARLQRLDKFRGEVLIFHGRNYPYITNLADISRYPFRTCDPIELKPLKNIWISVFHVENLLDECMKQKSKKLFSNAYQRQRSCSSTVSEDHRFSRYLKKVMAKEMQERGASAEVSETDNPDEIRKLLEELEKLREERIQKEQELSIEQQHCWLQSTEKDFHTIETKLRNCLLYQEEIGIRLDSEQLYRCSQMAWCHAVLAAKTHGEKKYIYRDWQLNALSGILRKLQKQDKTADFYPADSMKTDILLAGGLAAALYQFYNENYAASEAVIRYLMNRKGRISQVPDMREAVNHLYRLFDTVRKVSGISANQDPNGEENHTEIGQKRIREALKPWWDFLGGSPEFEEAGTQMEENMVWMMLKPGRKNPAEEENQQIYRSVLDLCRDLCRTCRN